MNTSQTPLLRLFVLAAIISFAGTAAARAPLVALDFTSVQDGVATSAKGNYSLHLDDAVKVLPDGPTGTPYILLDGTPDSSVRQDARQVSQKLGGAEVGASFWFRADALDDVPIALGFSMKKATSLSEAPFGFSLPTKENDFGSYKLGTRFEGNTSTATGAWHHAAFRYSISNDTFTVWLDGFPQRNVPIGADEPSPIDNLFAAPFAKGFKGAIADLRVWDYAPEDTEILQADISPKSVGETAAAFEKAAATPRVQPSFAAWCKANAAKARSFGKAANVRDWMSLQDARAKLPELVRLSSALASSPALGNAPLLPISIYPFHWLKRLPFRMPEDARPCSEIKIRAALGEFEAASFMAYPFASGTFHIKATDLTAASGAKLPASVIDIRTTKFWHSHASGWYSYFGGGKDFPVLTGEILLHDDAMLKVDRDAHKNYLRVSYPDGARYVDISKAGTPENMEAFLTDVEPVYDAKTFQPMPLAEGQFSQLWITAHIPENATPGDYTGKLELSLDGKPAGSIPVSLTVYPFKLPRAAPRYNIDELFTGIWYHHINLDTKLGSVSTYHQGGINSFSNACLRLLGEYRNMHDHNMFTPFSVSYGDPTKDDLTDAQIDLMEKAGLVTNPLFGDLSGMDGFWCAGMGRDMKAYNFDISVETNYELFKERMQAFSNEVSRVAERVKARLGHNNLYCYGIDEAGPGTVRREMPFFATIMNAGFHPQISMAIAEWCAFMADFDNIPAFIGRTVARNWHEGGAKVGTYAAPFSGPENPELWRRSMGIRIYMANYDGVANYNWYEGFNVWNNFVNAGRYGNFCIVYPTADGVVDTVGWEAQREGIDDIRYLTLLRRLARAAMRTDKREIQRLGKRAYAWAELVDPESVELDDMRLEAVDWILKLRTALKDVDTEKLYE